MAIPLILAGKHTGASQTLEKIKDLKKKLIYTGINKISFGLEFDNPKCLQFLLKLSAN